MGLAGRWRLLPPGAHANTSAWQPAPGGSFHLRVLKLRAKLDRDLRKAAGLRPALSHFKPVDVNLPRPVPWALLARMLAVPVLSRGVSTQYRVNFYMICEAGE